MPQIPRKRAPITRRPPAVTPRPVARKRPVPIRAVKVQQQMRLPGDRVIPKRRGPLHAALDDGAVAPRAGPLAKEPRAGRLDEDGLAGLVLHEAEEGGRVVGAVVVEREEGEVDDVGRGFVDVGLGRGEGFEVAGVGVADADVGGGAGVARVGGWVLFRSG